MAMRCSVKLVVLAASRLYSTGKCIRDEMRAMKERKEEGERANERAGALQGKRAKSVKKWSA